MNEKDITGQKFGRLTAIRLATKEEKGNKQGAYWVCQCDCGNTKIVKGGHLRDGNTTSCGCYQRECAKQKMNALWESGKGYRGGKATPLDLIGLRFGKLIVIAQAESITEASGKKRGQWECICDCGQTTIVETNHLTSGRTQSCGCCKFSKGELKIQCLLEENNIPFEMQKHKIIKGHHHYFDFFVDNKYFIEYDGEQHSQPSNKWYRGTERDEEKDTYCKENNIPLIRIPYTKLDKLTIEDITLT